MSEENRLFHLPPDTMHTRWASAENLDAQAGAGGIADKGRKGAPCRRSLEPGETFTMAHAAEAGTLHRFWITLSERSPQMLRGLVLRIYWDGESKPAVEAPIGDFFCLPQGRMVAFGNAWFDTGEGRSFNCRVPMPFRKGFRMTVANESASTLAMFFYDVNFTVGDRHSRDVGYFHAHWRRENLTVIGHDFEIMPRVEGRGRFLGCNMGVIANQVLYDSLWWGEGEVKIYWRAFDGGRSLYKSNLLRAQGKWDDDSFWNPKSDEGKALLQRYTPGMTPEQRTALRNKIDGNLRGLLLDVPAWVIFSPELSQSKC